MCYCQPDPPPSNLALVRLAHMTEGGRAFAGVDPCIAPLVQALNDAGIQTVASCCGHNQRPGRISLEDGRELVITDYEGARRIDRLWPNDIHGRAKEDR